MSRWLAIAFVLGIFVLSALAPLGYLEAIPLCHIKLMIGINCPGCGLTRAFFYLFHGSIREAISMNALAPVLVLWFSIYALEHGLALKNGKRPLWHSPEGNRLIGRLFLLLFIGQWAFGNIPGYF